MSTVGFAALRRLALVRGLQNGYEYRRRGRLIVGRRREECKEGGGEGIIVGKNYRIEYLLFRAQCFFRVNSKLFDFSKIQFLYSKHRNI